MKRTILVLTLILCIFLTGCEKVVEEETVKIVATVVEKNHKKTFITFYTVGKTTVPQVHPEEFEVTLEYEDVIQTFDDEALYNRVSEGDKVRIFLYNGYNEDHEIVTRRLLLPN